MSAQAWITLALLAAASSLFVTEWLRVDLVALSVVTALMLTTILTPAEALAGFSNPLPITAGQVHFKRGGPGAPNGTLALLNETWLVSKRLAGNYVWATVTTYSALGYSVSTFRRAGPAAA